MNEFEKLYRLHSSMVFNLALYYTRNNEEAEEITQDVFLKIYDKHADFRGDAELKTWIYRITINRCLDVLKSKKSKKNAPWQFRISTEHLSGNLVESPEDPLKTLENKQALNSLMDCIHQLPPDQRDVVLLLKIEGLTQQETAEILNRSPKAVESLFHRAKQALKMCWESTKKNAN